MSTWILKLLEHFLSWLSSFLFIILNLCGQDSATQRVTVLLHTLLFHTLPPVLVRTAACKLQHDGLPVGSAPPLAGSPLIIYFRKAWGILTPTLGKLTSPSLRARAQAVAGASTPRVGEIKRRRSAGVEKPDPASPPSTPALAGADEGAHPAPAQPASMLLPGRWPG